jgi:sugar phosphate isomerase/epimerase
MPARIALFTECLLSMPLMEAIGAAARTGVAAIELACRAPHLDLDTARSSSTRVAGTITGHGLEVSALSLYSSFTEPQTLDAQIDAAETYVRLAPAYGTRIVKVTPGRPGSAAATEGHWQGLARALDRLIPIAEALGVKLAFETHMRQLTDTVAGSKRLLGMSDSGALGLTVDFSNLSFAGETVDTVFAELADRMYNTHVKNGVIDARGEWWFLPLDIGWTDYAQVCRRLRECAYDGWLTVECLGRDAAQRPIEVARRDLELLRRFLSEAGIEVAPA